MNPSSSFRVQGELKYDNKQQLFTLEVTIIKLLQIVAGDTNLASELIQYWKIREFKLGDDLTSNVETTSNLFHLVCQGRVRLLSFDATLGREVSTGLLLAEQSFGADNLFCDRPFAYRAIGASPGIVAQITISDLQIWLQRLPHLENHLQKLALQRQALIFFKSYTELRSLNSTTLKQFLPYIITTKITAGSSLATATPATQGRFWLADGTTTSPSIGDSWGYPDEKSPDVIAQTDLLVYHLPSKEWESARTLAPQILTRKTAEKTLSSPLQQIPLPKLEYSQTEIPTTPEIDFEPYFNQPPPKTKLSLSRYWQTLQPYRNLLQYIILVSLVIQVFGLAVPLLTQIVLDQVIPLKSISSLNAFALGFLCLGVWRIILTAQRQYLLDYFANRIDINFIGGFIKHTLQLPLQFFALHQVEDILGRVPENRKIQQFLSRQAITGTVDVVMIVVYLGVMAYFNLRLTLLVAGGIVPVVILTLAASSYLKQVSQEVLQASARQNSVIVEMMTGIVAVKTAAAENPVQRYWEEHFHKMLKVQLRQRKLANVLQMLRNLICHVATTVVLWCGLQLVISEQMSLGQFVAFNMLISNVTNLVLGFVGLWDELPEVLTAVERVNDVLDSPPEESTSQPLQVMPTIRGEVRFENVCFRYHPDNQRYTLQNVSCWVKPKQTIGIIGQSGSGKSTLVSLLAGLYRPTSGRILIDGLDIGAVSVQSLRSQIGFVTQDSLLFSGTVLENITFNNADFNREQAIAAAKLAEAHGFIRDLPLGYDTPVGERGLRLSGGQRQKIAIARALITNPKILILDEATSALDLESERYLYQRLARFSQFRTTFIVSHRLSSVRHADHILVLDQGMLVAQGTHQELINHTGLYSRLVAHDFEQ